MIYVIGKDKLDLIKAETAALAEQIAIEKQREATR